MPQERSQQLFVRLPADLRRWIAEEAARTRRSLNAVLIEAIYLFRADRTASRCGRDHAAAIEQAIVTA